MTFNESLKKAKDVIDVIDAICDTPELMEMVSQF